MNSSENTRLLKRSTAPVTGPSQKWWLLVSLHRRLHNHTFGDFFPPSCWSQTETCWSPNKPAENVNICKTVNSVWRHWNRKNRETWSPGLMICCFHSLTNTNSNQITAVHVDTSSGFLGFVVCRDLQSWFDSSETSKHTHRDTQAADSLLCFKYLSWVTWTIWTTIKTQVFPLQRKHSVHWLTNWWTALIFFF